MGELAGDLTRAPSLPSAAGDGIDADEAVTAARPVHPDVHVVVAVLAVAVVMIAQPSLLAAFATRQGTRTAVGGST